MLGYDAAVALALEAPDGLIDSLAVKHQARVLREELDYVELAARKLHRLPVVGNRAVGVVDGQGAVEANLAGRHVAALAPQVRVHARGQLAGREGLDDVVVGAGGETAQLVALFDPRGEEDDGAGDVRAYHAADLQPVYVRHADVQND